MKRTMWPITLGIAGMVATSCGKDSLPEMAAGTEADSGIVLEGTVTGTGIGADDAIDGDSGDKLDAGNGTATAGGGDCMGGGGMMGENTFSIIWIANSPEGTVSKIDTKTGMELARFYSGPTDGDDDPSRTSVNLEGDVAVSNRSGSVTKFASEDVRCIDANNNGSIETSTGAADVLPFGEDECMLWHIQLEPDDDHRKGPRPTAWDAGADANPCEAADDRLWLGWWRYDENVARFQRRGGADGALLDEVDVPEWDTQGNTDYGPYGGAVNAAGDLYSVGRGPGPLVRIDAASLAVDRWEIPDGSNPYGIAVDSLGRVWMGSTEGSPLHFDPDTETFEVIDTPNSSRTRGIMVDRDGYAWAAGNDPCMLIQLDTNTKTVVNDQIALPGCQDPVGISIDADAFVWVVDRDAELAYKVHPQTYMTTTTTGLVGPYTYSDMTGAGLGLVVNPPQG